MGEKRKIAKRAGTVGFFTFLSRIAGLFRDMAVAHAFGTRLAADAFFVAFRIPNLLRRLFAEGALTVSFVPVFSKTLRESEAEAKRVASVSFTLMLVVLTLLSVAGVALSPWLVKLTAWGFSKDPEKYELTVFLTRVMFPYILLVSLAAWGMGVLNSLKRFAVPASASIFMNLGIIAGALYLAHRIDPPVLGLALGVLIGGFFQLAVHFPSLARLGFFPRLRWDPKHPAVRRIVGMMIPAAYGAAVYQFNVMAMTLFASFLPEGSVSYLWYADRVMEFPLGIFAISIATVLLPTLADHAAADDRKAFRETFLFGLRLAFFITLPAAAGLIALAPDIVGVLFEHGSFEAVSTLSTARALVFFALGLPFISGVRITSNAFYALHDAKAPVRAANAAVVLNLILALGLMGPLKHNGLALALSLSAVGNFALQLFYLRRKRGPLGLKSLLPSLGKSGLASLLMGAGVWWLGQNMPSLIAGKPGEAVRVALLIGAGAAAYLLLGLLMRMEEVRGAWNLVRRRGRPSAPPPSGPPPDVGDIGGAGT